MASTATFLRAYFWSMRPYYSFITGIAGWIGVAFARFLYPESVSVGHSIPSTRPIVDSSFDIGILVTFANSRDMQSYLIHPTHKAATETILKPLVSKIVVYDFIEHESGARRTTNGHE